MSTTEHVNNTAESLRRRDERTADLQWQPDSTDHAFDGVSASRPMVAAPSTSAPVGSSAAAARLLEIAAVNADELLTEAKSDAAATLASAQAEAEQVTASSIAEADQVRAAAQAEAERVTTAAHTEAESVRARLEEHRIEQTAELNRHRSTVLSELAERKAELEAEVDRLQQHERDHRNRMRRYFAEQLEQLGTAEAPSDNVD